MGWRTEDVGGPDGGLVFCGRRRHGCCMEFSGGEDSGFRVWREEEVGVGSEAMDAGMHCSS